MSNTPNNPLKEADIAAIQQLIKKYDQLYAELNSAEAQVQKIMEVQKTIVEALTATREMEEYLFERIASRENVEMDFVKKLASAWASENTQKKN
jgi:hypothetical protein